MGIPYLKVEPEEAIKILDESILSGYKTKDTIAEEYFTDKTQVVSRITGWKTLANDWLVVTIGKLDGIFMSQKEVYNFRDSRPPLGATSEDVQYVKIIQTLKARIDKLNEYDSYIRDKFDVKIEVVLGDKITQHGNNSSVEIK
jgi:hypothetical protein